jgi:hypothetical protein
MKTYADHRHFTYAADMCGKMKILKRLSFLHIINVTWYLIYDFFFPYVCAIHSVSPHEHQAP